MRRGEEEQEEEKQEEDEQDEEGKEEEEEEEEQEEEEEDERKKKKSSVNGAVFINKFRSNQAVEKFLIKKTFQFTYGLLQAFKLRVIMFPGHCFLITERALL